MMKDISQIEKKFKEYEGKVQRLKRVEEELNSLKKSYSQWFALHEFNQLVSEIERDIKKPSQVGEVESNFKTLKQMIEKKKELEREKEEVIRELEDLAK